MEYFFKLDQTWYFWINHDLGNPVFDFLMPLITNFMRFPLVLYAFLPLGVALWLWKGGKKAWCAVGLAILLATVVDQLMYRVVKQNFHRQRPHHVLTDAKLRLEHSPKSSSFPSNHAANTMAIALLLVWYYPRRKYLFLSIPLVVGFSRVYVGVHYPSDVVAGWAIGALIFYVFWRWAFKPVRYLNP